MSSHTRKQLEAYLGRLSINAEAVVDIGGSQLPVKDRLESFSAKRYDILDLQQPHKGKAPDIVCDINEAELPGLPYQSYDVAFCLEVMEYIWNPVVALENMARMLKPMGTLYISFPFIYPQHEPLSDDCLRYTRIGAVKLLTLTGFMVDHVTTRKALNGTLLKSMYAAEGMRPASTANHEEVGCIIKAIKKPS